MEYTYEELMVEYLEFIIKLDPNEEFVVRDGEGVRFKTGDPWFDGLDEKIASGADLTLADLGLPKEEIAKLNRQKKQQEPPVVSPPPDEPFEEVNDTYGKDNG